MFDFLQSLFPSLMNSAPAMGEGASSLGGALGNASAGLSQPGLGGQMGMLGGMGSANGLIDGAAPQMPSMDTGAGGLMAGSGAGAPGGMMGDMLGYQQAGLSPMQKMMMGRMAGQTVNQLGQAANPARPQFAPTQVARPQVSVTPGVQMPPLGRALQTYQG